MIVVQSIAVAGIARLLSSAAATAFSSGPNLRSNGLYLWLAMLGHVLNAILLIKHAFSFIFHSTGRLHHLHKWYDWSNRQLYVDSKETIPDNGKSSSSAVVCASPNARHLLHSKFQDSYFVTKQRQLLGISHFLLAHYLLLNVVGFLVDDRTMVSTEYFEPLAAALLLLSLVLVARVQWRYIVREVNSKESVKIAVAIALHASGRVDTVKHSFTSNIATSMSNCLVQLPVDISLQCSAFKALALLLEVRVHWYDSGHFPLFDRMFSASVGYDEVSQLAVDMRSLEVALVENHQSPPPDAGGSNALISRGDAMQRRLSRRLLLYFAGWMCNVAAVLCLLAFLAKYFFVPPPLPAGSADAAMRVALLLSAVVDLVVAVTQAQRSGGAVKGKIA